MSEVVEPSITLVKRIRAAPERVWHAFTDAATMMQWFGPHHTRAEIAEADLRMGGRFRVVLREESGLRHEVSGSYLEIAAPARLVFDWRWTATPERISRVTVRFRAVEEGTELTLTHDRFADGETAKRHVRGWTESLERLVGRFDG